MKQNESAGKCYRAKLRKFFAYGKFSAASYHAAIVHVVSVMLMLDKENVNQVTYNSSSVNKNSQFCHFKV